MSGETTTSKTTTPIPFDYKSLLGGRCLTKRNCHTSIAVCVQSICTCPKGFFPVDDWTCLEDSGISNSKKNNTFISFSRFFLFIFSKKHLMKNLLTQHPPFLQRQQRQSFVGGHGHQLRPRLDLILL